MATTRQTSRRTKQQYPCDDLCISHLFPFPKFKELNTYVHTGTANHADPASSETKYTGSQVYYNKKQQLRWCPVENICPVGAYLPFSAVSCGAPRQARLLKALSIFRGTPRPSDAILVAVGVANLVSCLSGADGTEMERVLEGWRTCDLRRTSREKGDDFKASYPVHRSRVGLSGI